MGRALVGEEIAWLCKLRDSKEANAPAPVLPPEIAFLLRMRGYVTANAHGVHAITTRGMYELITRERDRIGPTSRPPAGLEANTSMR
jgi:hypothetical protein